MSKKEYRLTGVLHALKRLGYLSDDVYSIKECEFEYSFSDAPDIIYFGVYEKMVDSKESYILDLPVVNVNLINVLKPYADADDICYFKRKPTKIRMCLRRMDVKFASSPFWKESLLKEGIYQSLLINHNTIYTKKDYDKAVEYFDSEKALIKALSKLVGFDVSIRAPEEANQDNEYPYYIIEEIGRKRA